MRNLLLMAITSICSIGALRSPAVGMLSYIAYGVLVPQAYTWGWVQSFPHSKLITVCTVVGYLFSRDPKIFPRQREFILLLALFAMFGISTFFAFIPWRANTQFEIVSKIFVTVFLLISVINTEYRLQLLMKIVAIGLGLLGLKIGIFVVMTGGGSPVWGPPGSYLEANNTLGMALALNVPFLFYLSNLETRPWLRWAMRVMIFFSYPAVIGTHARASWVGLAVMTGLMVLKSKYKFRTFIAAGLVAVIGFIFIAPRLSTSVSDRYDSLVNYEEDSSAQSRFWNWEFCRRIAMEYPVFGMGFKFYGAWQSIGLYEKYFPEYLAEWGDVKYAWSCHNMWLLVLSEHGFIAFFLWCGLFASVFASLRQIRNFGGARPEMSWTVSYANMLGIAIVGFMIIGIFVDFAYYEMFYHYIGAVIIMKRLVQAKEGEAVSPAAAPAAANRPVLAHGT